MGDVARKMSGMREISTASLPPQPPPPPATHQPSRAMKMTGVSREVMELLTGRQDQKSAALPPIVPTIAPATDTTVKVGNRFISASKPARKWVWAPFASSARTDGALFRHWVRANVEYPDYPYARFDIHLDPVAYTDDEYRRYLQDDTWTKNETDKLMDLAKCFELRWAVIHDRWCDGKTQERRVEDLQHRYYGIAAILLQLRIAKEAASEVATLTSNVPVVDPTIPVEEAKATAENHQMETAAARALAAVDVQHQPLVATLGTGTTNKNAFDLGKERERRATLELIWHRTKEEELEEDALRKELRLVDAQLRKLKKSGGHILAAANRGSGGMLSSAASSCNPSRSVSPVPLSTSFATSDAALLDQCFASTAPTPMASTPYLQSGRLAPPATGGPVGLNKTTLKRMDTVLEELKIPQHPIPTKRVCDLYDEVRKDALTLLTLQKMVLVKEGQLQSKRFRLAKLGGGGRLLDDEALLGIVPTNSTPPPETAGTTATTTSATVASVGSGVSRGKVAAGGKIKQRTSSSTGKKTVTKSKADGNESSKLDSSGIDGTGGKTARKSSAKRKKKTESKPPPPTGATIAAVPVTVSVPVVGEAHVSAPMSRPAVGDDTTDDGKAGKKRSRKN